jgi:hypothetical protein
MNLILLFVSVIFVNSIRVTESEWSLVFKDEFNGEELDSNNWVSTKELSEKNKIMFINEYSITTNSTDPFTINENDCNNFLFTKLIWILKFFQFS